MSDTPAGIDPRGPRFGASITSLLLAVTIVLGLAGSSAGRALTPAFLLLLAVALLFLWAVLSPRTAPWGRLFRAVVRPRLRPPTQWEDPRPPRFAQGVGLFVSVVGLVLSSAGVAWGVPVAAAVAFVAAFLNAAFGFCLGCQTYLLLQRLGVIGRSATA